MGRPCVDPWSAMDQCTLFDFDRLSWCLPRPGRSFAETVVSSQGLVWLALGGHINTCEVQSALDSCVFVQLRQGGSASPSRSCGSVVCGYCLVILIILKLGYSFLCSPPLRSEGVAAAHVHLTWLFGGKSHVVGGHSKGPPRLSLKSDSGKRVQE